LFFANFRLPFPSNEILPTLLSGCKGNSTFVFGFWDYQDKFAGGPNEVFFLNAVNYVLDPFSCIETEAPSDSPTDLASASPTEFPSTSPTASVAPSASPSCTPLEIKPLTSWVVFVNGTIGAPMENGLLQVNVTSGEDLTYSWTTTCANTIFSDATIANPILLFKAGTADEICKVAVIVCSSCGICDSLNEVVCMP
jgi:hypothetical protein